MQERIKKPSRIGGILLRGALVLLMAIACVPAEALAAGRQAWGATWGYAAYYGNKDDGYILVLQSSSTAKETYGQMDRYDALHGDAFAVNQTLRENITRVVVSDPISAPRSLFGCFKDMKRCTSIDLSGLDTSGVTDMGSMFSGCSALQSIDLSGLDTSGVTDMGSMFSDCSSLQSLDLSGLDTSGVADMDSMFSGCSSLQSLDLSPLDTSRVTDMGGMFASCSALQSIDLSPLDTSRVTDMGGIFFNCSSLQSLDLSGLDTSGVADMDSMFSGCSSLQSLDLSPLDTSRVTDMSFMFQECSSLQSIDLSGLNASHVQDTEYMLSSCRALRSIILPEEFSQLFGQALSAESEWKHVASGKTYLPCDIPNGLGGEYVLAGAEPDDPQQPAPPTDPVENSSGGYFVYYENADKQGYTLVLQNSSQQDARYGKKVGSVPFNDPWNDSDIDTTLDISGLKFGDLKFDDLDDYFANNDARPDPSETLSQSYMRTIIEHHVTRVIMRDLLNAPSSMFGWFSTFLRCTSIDLSKLDTSAVTDMTATFKGCLSLTQLNLSSFTTSNVLGMGQMFSECRSLRHLDVSSFDTSKVTTMQAMFYNAGIEELDASNFTGIGLDPDKALNPDYGWDTMDMFSGCANLKSLNLSRFEVRGDCDAWNMFENCTSLCHVVLSAQASQPFGKELPEKEWRHDSGKIFTPKTIPAQFAGTYVTSEYVPPAPPTKPTTPGSAKPAPVPTPSPMPSKPAQPTSIAKAQVTVKSKTYTGKTQKPSSVTVKVGGKKLVSGRDYNVSCKGGKKVGSYKVTIKGKGAYAGTKTATFKILPKGTSIKKVKAAKRGFTVAWKKPSKANLKQTTGYKVQWSTDKKFKKAVKSKLVKKSKTTSLKASKLKGGKKYYVRVCTYKKTGGKYYCSAWSKAKAVKTKK